jgi:hypothetical protein
MATSGLYGRRTDDPNERAPGDRDRDGVDDRVEAREERLVDRDRDGVDDRAEARRTATVDRDGDRAGQPVDQRVGPAKAPAEPRWRARASLLATLALIVGLSAVYASLSGRLAPVGVALGVLGLLLSIGGLTATGRPRVAGGGVALFALLLSVAGATFGVLAMGHTASWLDSDVDQVARWRDWLDAQLPFIRDW